jgi:hypothetical protein
LMDAVCTIIDEASATPLFICVHPGSSVVK